MKNPGGGGGVRDHPGQEFDSWRHQTHQVRLVNNSSSKITAACYIWHKIDYFNTNERSPGA